MQWQRDAAADRFIPVLEWIEQQSRLYPIDKGLLEKMRRTQAAGEEPHCELPGQLIP